MELPGIRILARPDPSAFLDGVGRLAAVHGGYEATRCDDLYPADFEVLTVRLTTAAPHQGLSVQLLVCSSRGPWADVEVRAADWERGPAVPDRETYIAAAKRVLGPLLRAYNREHGTRRRLLVERPTRSPPLPPIAAGLFERFATLANTRVLHPYDWERLYNFVRHCAAHNVAVSSSGLHRLLLSAGFHGPHAERIVNVFDHGRRLLTYRR